MWKPNSTSLSRYTGFGAYIVVLISSKKQVEKRSDRGRLSGIGNGELFEAEMNS